MDLEKLKCILITKNVPDYFYNLDGVGEFEQRVCLINEDFKWIVFSVNVVRDSMKKNFLVKKKPVKIY